MKQEQLFKYILLGDTSNSIILYEYPSKIDEYSTPSLKLFKKFSNSNSTDTKNEMNKITKTNEVFYFVLKYSLTFYFVVVSLETKESIVSELISDLDKAAIYCMKTDDTLSFQGIKKLESVIERIEDKRTAPYFIDKRHKKGIVSFKDGCSLY